MRDDFRLPLALLLGSASLLLVASCGSGEAKPSAVDNSTSAQPTSASTGTATPGAASTGTATPGAAGAEIAPRGHPCDFVTQAEASTILNKAATAGYDGSSACIYTADGKQTILRFMAGERSDFDYNKENGYGTPFDVPGIGDAAACETDTDTPRLNFYSSKAKQVVTVTGESCDIDKQFALKAVSRL